MKLLVFLLLMFARAVSAADAYICPGDPGLGRITGYYALATVLDVAPKLRSWPEILRSIDSDKAGILIRDRNVFFSRSWHEGDTGGNCVRQDKSGLWVMDAYPPHAVYGPYRFLAGNMESESLAYLTQFISGCFSGSDGSRWCFSRKQISVNGRPFTGVFDLDAMELPEYGTSLKVTGGRSALLVLAPVSGGWAVYADEYVTSESRVPVVPGRTKPVFLLNPEAKQ